MPAPAITVTDPTAVAIDGRHAGAVVDVIANHATDPADPDHAAFRGALHAALVAAHVAREAAFMAALKDHSDRCAAALDAQSGQHAATVAKMVAGHAAALKSQADQHAAIQAATAQAQADALAAAGAAHAEDLAKRQDATTTVRDELARHKAVLADLGGESAWQATAPGRRAALLAAQARIAADLAAHDAAASQAGVPTP